MTFAKTETLRSSAILIAKMQDYLQLIKLRLTLLVVFSAGMGYLFALSGSVNWGHLSLLLLSGFLITGSANGINQIIEKDIDKLMTRTADRPVAAGRLSSLEAGIITVILGVFGVAILSVFMNSITALLGLFSLLAYAFVYTPLKRHTSFAVLAGAFPGAMPPIIGYTALAGSIDMACMVLFAIQFVWQFPHFWSIAWILHEDYKKAGIYLLPGDGKKTKKNAKFIFLSTILLLPPSSLPLVFGIINGYFGMVIILASFAFLYLAYKVYKECSQESARQLMFGSIVFLPLVQIILVLGRI